MPLTLELYGSDKDKSAHIIFDRKRITLAFTEAPLENSSSILDMLDQIVNTLENSSAHDQLTDAFKDSILTLSEFDKFQTYGASNPAHAVYEHMCEYDRNAPHAHFAFKQDVTPDLIEKIFSKINFDQCHHLFSKECASEIIDVATVYFHDMKHSATTIAIQSDYLKDKEIQASDMEKRQARQQRLYDEKGPHMWANSSRSPTRQTIEISNENNGIGCRIS